MRFFDIALKNVFRRKVRSLLTTLSVAVGVGAVTSLVSFATGLKRTAAEVYSDRGADLIVNRANVMDPLTSSLPESVETRLAEQPGVAEVAGCLKAISSLGEGSLLGIQVHGLRPGEFALQNLQISEGQTLSANEKSGVLLGRTLARSLNKTVGDTVDIESQPFKIVGFIRGNNPLDEYMAAVTLSDLQTLMDQPKLVTEFQIRLAPDLPDREAYAAKLRADVSTWKTDDGKPLGMSVRTSQDFADNLTEVKLSNALSLVCAVVALLVGGVGMLNTMTMAVLERTQEIGMLRAIGWRQRRIGLLVLCEAQLLSWIGAAVGVAGGAVAIYLLAQSHYSQGLVRPHVPLWVMTAAAVLAPAVGVIGGSYPALRASRLPPMEALRYE